MYRLTFLVGRAIITDLALGLGFFADFEQGCDGHPHVVAVEEIQVDAVGAERLERGFQVRHEVRGRYAVGLRIEVVMAALRADDELVAVAARFEIVAEDAFAAVEFAGHPVRVNGRGVDEIAAERDEQVEQAHAFGFIRPEPEFDLSVADWRDFKVCVVDPYAVHKFPSNNIIVRRAIVLPRTGTDYGAYCSTIYAHAE